jgi:AraC-like DNA-binding protein
VDRIPEWGRAQIAILLEFGREQGVSVEQCLVGSGLTAEDWSRVDPSKAQEAMVIHNLIKRVNLHPFLLGVTMGQRCDLITFGLLGKAMMASPTLAEVAGLASRYLGGELHFNRIRFRHKQDAVYTLFEPVGYYPEPVASFLLARDMGATIAFHQHVLRSIPELLTEIGFLSDWLPGMEILEQHFDCEVKVKQPENYTKGNKVKHYLTMPFANSFLFDQFDKQLQRLVGLPNLSRGRELPLKQRIAHHLSAMGYQSVSREDMASRLNVSARTLARYLQSEGTTWRQLVTDIRLNHAQHLLQNTPFTIEKVAFSVGFSSASAFSAAFTRETSCSPAEFRARSD